MTIMFEDIESEEGYREDPEYDEATRSARAVRTARPARMPPRPSGQPVGQAQFAAAIAQLQNDISRNSAAIRQVDSRVAAVGRDVAQVRRDSTDRRKDVSGLRAGLAKTQQAVEILPLLSNTLGSSNQALADILPFLLIGGMGTGGGTDANAGMFGNDMMMMLVLVLALSGGLGK